jgi:osomolarity two-component system, sensor histidine kinase NIK1
MQGDMWVESEIGKGSKFYFTIQSQISTIPGEVIMQKMAPFAQRTILFVDTLRDKTGVAETITELGLRPFIVHDIAQVADKSRTPHIDTILVDSLPVVSPFLSFVTCLSAVLIVLLQTEMLREIEHLRYIPVVLVAPVSYLSYLRMQPLTYNPFPLVVYSPIEPCVFLCIHHITEPN